jgi:hypothetical protein
LTEYKYEDLSVLLPGIKSAVVDVVGSGEEDDGERELIFSRNFWPRQIVVGGNLGFEALGQAVRGW